jgi:hypothetical protein
VEDLGSGELLVMRKAYPRFVPPEDQRSFALSAWNHVLAYELDQKALYNDYLGKAFPKWRASHGQFMRFSAWGSFGQPMYSMNSGFYQIPYANEVCDYRYPAQWREMLIVTPKLAEKLKHRDIRSWRAPLALETIVIVFNNTPSKPSGDDHKLAGSVQVRSCSGYDFVIDPDGKGFFFLNEGHPKANWLRDESGAIIEPRVLPSKMVVLDYRIREENGWIPQIDRPDVGATKPEVPPAPTQKPKSPIVHKGGEVVVGMDQPGVFASAKRYTRAPDSVVSLKWTEKESFEAPFSIPFTAAVDGDDYFFVTNDGRIYRASPGQVDGAERTVERVFDAPDDPVIACIHESSTNRIFAFRRNSYLLVDNAHLPHEGTPQFAPSEDVTQPKAMTYLVRLFQIDLLFMCNGGKCLHRFQ